MKEKWLETNHCWALDEDGCVDDFAYDCDTHNGFRCIRCGFTGCYHCLVDPGKCPGVINASPDALVALPLTLNQKAAIKAAFRLWQSYLIGNSDLQGEGTVIARAHLLPGGDLSVAEIGALCDTLTGECYENQNRGKQPGRC